MLVGLIGEMKRRHQVSLGVAELFRHPTLGQMATLIDAQQPRGKRQPAVVPLQEGGSRFRLLHLRRADRVPPREVYGREACGIRH